MAYTCKSHYQKNKNLNMIYILRDKYNVNCFLNSYFVSVSFNLMTCVNLHQFCKIWQATQFMFCWLLVTA